MRLRFSFGNARLLVPGIIAAALCFCTSTFAADGTIGIPNVVPFAPGVDVPEAVRNECHLGEKVSTFLQQAASNVKVSDNSNEGRYVEMAITEVVAPGGGAFSGPKWMAVSGSLMENGKKVASFRAKRFSTGGAFGGFKGTCDIIGRCTKAIAQDISGWLKNPVDGAQLGDAK